MTKSLNKRIKELKEMIRSKEEIQGFISNPTIVSARINSAQNYLRGYSRKNGTQDLAIAAAQKELEKALDEVNKFFNSDWKTYQQTIDGLNLSLFKTYETLDIKR